MHKYYSIQTLKGKVAADLIFMHLFLVEQISLSKTVPTLPSITKIKNNQDCIGFHMCIVYDNLKDTSCHNMVINKHAQWRKLRSWFNDLVSFEKFSVDKVFYFFKVFHPKFDHAELTGLCNSFSKISQKFTKVPVQEGFFNNVAASAPFHWSFPKNFLK